MWLMQLAIGVMQALNYRNTLDSAGGDGKSGGAKPLPGPSYDQMDMQVNMCAVLSGNAVSLSWAMYIRTGWRTR
jgi:hypothetical protein